MPPQIIISPEQSVNKFTQRKHPLFCPQNMFVHLFINQLKRLKCIECCFLQKSMDPFQSLQPVVVQGETVFICCVFYFMNIFNKRNQTFLETRRCTTVRDSEGPTIPCNGGSDRSVWVMGKWSTQCVSAVDSGCHEISENIWFEYCRMS